MDETLDELNTFITSNDFNPDDYVHATEEKIIGRYVTLMNIFTVHFRTLFNKDPTLNIFQGVDYDKLDSTNRQMELFYEHLTKYKENEHDDDLVSIYSVDDVDINKCRELYILKIDKSEYACQFIIPLISLLSEENWGELEWSILPVKTE